ncbi:uncharacterized protein LOC142327756 [Lycorma delicatula]|uniref:uncharacterized protein LOC142327756 n=1 Tax=Lycorma delicatula TaxID=130591 RepID=UPI003F518333
MYQDYQGDENFQQFPVNNEPQYCGNDGVSLGGRNVPQQMCYNQNINQQGRTTVTQYSDFNNAEHQPSSPPQTPNSNPPLNVVVKLQRSGTPPPMQATIAWSSTSQYGEKCSDTQAIDNWNGEQKFSVGSPCCSTPNTPKSSGSEQSDVPSKLQFMQNASKENKNFSVIPPESAMLAPSRFRGGGGGNTCCSVTAKKTPECTSGCQPSTPTSNQLPCPSPSQQTQQPSQPQPMQFSGQPQSMQFSGQPQQMSFSGQPQQMSFSGQPQPMSFSGQPQPMSFSGQPQQVQFSGQLPTMQSLSQPQQMPCLGQLPQMSPAAFSQVMQTMPGQSMPGQSMQMSFQPPQTLGSGNFANFGALTQQDPNAGTVSGVSSAAASAISGGGMSIRFADQVNQGIDVTQTGASSAASLKEQDQAKSKSQESQSPAPSTPRKPSSRYEFTSPDTLRSKLQEYITNRPYPGPGYTGKIKPFRGPREDAMSCKTCYSPADLKISPAACQPCNRLEMTAEDFEREALYYEKLANDKYEAEENEKARAEVECYKGKMPPDFTSEEQIQFLKCLGATERAVNMFKELQSQEGQSEPDNPCPTSAKQPECGPCSGTPGKSLSSQSSLGKTLTDSQSVQQPCNQASMNMSPKEEFLEKLNSVQGTPLPDPNFRKQVLSRQVMPPSQRRWSGGGLCGTQNSSNVITPIKEESEIASVKTTCSGKNDISELLRQCREELSAFKKGGTPTSSCLGIQNSLQQKIVEEDAHLFQMMADSQQECHAKPCQQQQQVPLQIPRLMSPAELSVDTVPKFSYLSTSPFITQKSKIQSIQPQLSAERHASNRKNSKVGNRKSGNSKVGNRKSGNNKVSKSGSRSKDRNRKSGNRKIQSYSNMKQSEAPDGEYDPEEEEPCESETDDEELIRRYPAFGPPKQEVIRSLKDTFRLYKAHLANLRRRYFGDVVKSMDTVEDITPDIAAAMVYSQEEGKDLKGAPLTMYEYLYPESPSQPLVSIADVTSNLPTGYDDIVVPLVPPMFLHAADFPGLEDPSMLDSPRVIQIGPSPNLAEEPGITETKAPTDIAELVTGLAESGSPAYDLDEDEEEEPEDVFNVHLQQTMPPHYSRMQMRGSAAPNWFPGYYLAFQSRPGVLCHRTHGTVLEQIWQDVQPDAVRPGGGAVIIGE